MRLLVLSFAVALCTTFAQAAVSIGHVENGSVGQFLTSTGATPSAGGVAIGIFTSTPPASYAGITSFADLVTAGFIDVRTMAGGQPSDWAFPTIAGTASNIAISSLPVGTQLYLFAFNAGSWNSSTPSSSFSGSTEWAAVVDTANLSPSDLGTKSILLNTAAGSEIKAGTQSGFNINMTALASAPEPSRVMLLALGMIGCVARRRRS